MTASHFTLPKQTFRNAVIITMLLLGYLHDYATTGLILSTSIRTTKIYNDNLKGLNPSMKYQRNIQSVVTKSNKNENNSHTYDRRMSHEEQQSLLQKTVEMRRINTIKSEISIQSGGTLLLVALSKAAGYGEELDLIENAISEGESARELMVTGNMGLVYFCVIDILNKRRSRSGLQNLSKEDLVQEGAIGLARAVDKWNPEIGGKFSTYAVYWIRAAVLRCIAERDDFVRVPEHVSSAIRKVTRAAQTLGLNIDDYDETVFLSPEWREAKAAKSLAEVAGLTDRQLLEAMKVRERRKHGILSFESWMQKKQHYETDSASSSVMEICTEEDQTTASTDVVHLKAELGRFLRPKEMEALSWRYGLNSDNTNTASVKRNYVKEAEHDLFPPSTVSQNIPVRGKWGEAMSFSEVGNKMHVSAEYGRKLCHIALEKLKRAAEEGTLEAAYLV